jgi:hypothetical protein
MPTVSLLIIPITDSSIILKKKFEHGMAARKSPGKRAPYAKSF